MVVANMPIMMLCLQTCMILIAWMGAKAVVASGNVAGVPGGLTTGQLMSFFTYAFQILMSLMMVSMVFVMCIISKASVGRVMEILNEESDIVNKAEPVKEVKDGSITFENVYFKYSKDAEKDVLKNINLEIKSGERVGILGGTGSSKSSLVQLIPRLYDVTSGSVKIGGVDVRDIAYEELLQNVSVVFQQSFLTKESVYENNRY